MNIVKFIEDFPDENSCREHFLRVREAQGEVCKYCGSKHHFWLKDKWQWQCSSCRFRTTLRSGTMMENAKLPVRKWYLAMAFMSFSKKGISATELQKQLGHSRYESVWTMMHRIRLAIGKRDSLYNLEGMIEFDEGYFNTEISEKEKQNLKRGKGGQQQLNVAVMAESTALEDIETGRTSKQCGYFKMKVLESHQSEDINQIVQENVNERSIVFSDQSPSYFDLAKYVEVHITEKSTNHTTANTLRWVISQLVTRNAHY